VYFASAIITYYIHTANNYLHWRTISTISIIWEIFRQLDKIFDIFGHFFDIFYHFLTFFDIFWHLLTFVDICWHLSTFFDICWHFSTFSDIFRHFPTFSDMFRHFSDIFSTFFDVLNGDIRPRSRHQRTSFCRLKQTRRRIESRLCKKVEKQKRDFFSRAPSIEWNAE
jgi:hypothetical protein